MDNDFYSWKDKEVLILRVYHQAAASQDQVVSLHANTLKIRITAPPVSGQANQHLLKYLAELFAVPPKQLQLESRQRGRIKSIRINHPRTLPALISRKNSM